MMTNDLISEWAFYGKNLDTVAHLYLRPAQQPCLHPDLLFFCMYTCRLLVDKKLSLSMAQEIQRRLSLGSALEQSILRDEDRAHSLPAKTIAYSGRYTKNVISSSLMFRNNLHFRFGHVGFGFFGNAKRFDFCAQASVFALAETLCGKYTDVGEQPDEGNIRDEKALELLWAGAQRIGEVTLGRDLNRGNYRAAAGEIYKALCGEDALS